MNLTNTYKLQLLDLGDNPYINKLNSIGAAESIKIVSSCLSVIQNNYSGAISVGSHLDVTECPELWLLKIQSSYLESIDLSKNPKLNTLHIQSKPLKKLDLSNNVNLVSVEVCEASNTVQFNLEELNISGLTKLETLNVRNNYLQTLDLTTNSALKTIKCYGNKIKVLDVSNCSALTSLDCSPMATLESLYVDASQKINYITYNRSDDYIPAATNIVVR